VRLTVQVLAVLRSLSLLRSLPSPLSAFYVPYLLRSLPFSVTTQRFMLTPRPPPYVRRRYLQLGAVLLMWQAVHCTWVQFTPHGLVVVFRVP